MLRMIILSHNMSCHDLDAFVDQEFGSIGLGGGATIPSARVFWRIRPAGPDVIRHLGDGRGKEMGVMRVHAPKIEDA